MQLTDDQKAAHAAFTAFMVSPAKEMVISGPAGVGKSTLLKHMMQDQDYIKIQRVLGDTNIITNWYLTATTNKAAEVLQGSTGREASTIHSTLGIQVQNDFNTGTTKLTRRKNSDVISNSLLVVDECSMIDGTLDKFIDQCTYNCKIIYVGDHCQLAPVMEDISPVFLRNTPVQLNQVVRSQNAPPILALCQQLRQTVETGVFKPIQEVPGFIDFLGPQEAMDEVRKYFVEFPEELGANARILAYRNNQVQDYNRWIRTERQLPNNFIAGEWAISNAATQLIGSSSGRLRIEQEVRIHDVSAPEMLKITSADLLEVRRISTSFGEVWQAEDPAHVENLIKHYRRMKDWVSYFKIKEHIADLRPRDAATVYKAQGSTYHTVFVDLTDIGRCTNADQAARMLYVACSRPTHRICFIGNLPRRFQGD